MARGFAVYCEGGEGRWNGGVRVRNVGAEWVVGVKTKSTWRK
jgi:hypothetical protein